MDVIKASGAATAGIPIHVPPGRTGLSPRLALRYASHGGQGPYGKGWSLELGRIERSTRKGVPRYTDDDGFRLLLPDGRSVELTEKAVEPGTGATRWLPPFEEAFLRVVQRTDNTWEVWDRGGTKLTFGGTNTRPGSDTSLSARVGPEVGLASGTFGWHLTRIQDPNGNTLEATYERVVGEAAGTYVYPRWIDYGGNASAAFPHKHHVLFTWEARPDPIESGSAGYLSRLSRRLQKIDLSTDAVKGGLPFQTYALTYLRSPHNGQSLLQSATRRGPTQSLPPASFSYRDNTTPERFRFAGGPYGWTAPQTGAQIWSKDATTNYTDLKTMDLDGDGLPDRVDASGWTSTNKRWKVYLNNGRGFNAPINWPAPRPWIQVVDSVDITGDGVADLVTVRDTFDIDGDGKPDTVDCGSTPWKVYFNDGAGFSLTATSWDAPRKYCRTAETDTFDWSLTYTRRDTMDLNGDSRPDYVRAGGWTGANPVWKVSWNTGSGFAPEEDFRVERRPGGTEKHNKLRLGEGGRVNTFDVTNDGLPDHIWIPESGTPWHIYVNDGKSLRYRADWTPPLTRLRKKNASNNYEWDIFDIDGDGYADLVDGRNYNANGGYWEVYRGTGDPDTGFSATPSLWKAPFRRIRYDGGKNRDVFDLDGDRIVDFVDGLAVADYWQVWLGQGFTYPQKVLKERNAAGPVRPDLLERAENGLGGSVSLAYRPSTVWDNTGGDGVPDLPFPVWTVSSLAQDNGLSTRGAWRYTYQNGRLDAADPLGIELRGFGFVTGVDPLGDRFETNFHQDPVMKGKPAFQGADDAKGVPVRDVYLTWATRSFTYPLLGVDSQEI